jgi:hypothetical protein
VGTIRDRMAALLGPVSTSAVPVALPANGTFVAPGEFRFDYPWPWEQSNDAPQIVDADGQANDSTSLGALFAPRTSGEADFLLWSGSGYFDRVWPELFRRLPSLYGTSAVRQRRLRLADSRAALAELDLRDGRHVSRLLATMPRSGLLLHAEFRVPTASFDGYRAHRDSMFASWEWR